MAKKLRVGIIGVGGIAGAHDTRQMTNAQLTLADNATPRTPPSASLLPTRSPKANRRPVPPEESLIVMSILDGLYRSAEQGKEVKL
jgi:predicted dehydrogenase